ncbi:protein of unknown function [Agreia sp. COWG]|nr:protein of unknown function [Agreia sp. COWG]
MPLPRSSWDPNARGHNPDAPLTGAPPRPAAGVIAGSEVVAFDPSRPSWWASPVRPAAPAPS